MTFRSLTLFLLGAALVALAGCEPKPQPPKASALPPPAATSPAA